MILAFSIHSGELSFDGIALGPAYSGHAPYVNDSKAALDTTEFVGKGPIPPGMYWIRAAITHPHLGPVVMKLDPCKPMLRGGFYIHGDNPSRDKSASHGCVVADRPIRETIANSGAKILVVNL